MRKSDDADIVVPILLAIAVIVFYGVYHTYIAAPPPAFDVVAAPAVAHQ